jgi:serine/threonine protein phosphatase PrpC
VRITAAAATDIGRVRERNEDAFLDEAPLFAVADGVGGHQGGEVASRLALETMEALFRRGRTLTDQVREANRTVFERSLRDPALAGMGTTITAALADDGRLRIAHVGDSRAYLLRRGDLRMLTEDHTLVHRMVSEGEITSEEARIHPHRNIVTRAVGTEPDVQVDEGVLDAQDGDRILLCTDGLTGMLADEEIAATLREAKEPKDAVKRLVRQANAAGGVDNITVMVLDLKLEDHEAAPRSSERSAADTAASAPRTGRVAPPSQRTGRAARGATSGGRRLLRRAGLWVIALAVVVVVAGFGLRFYLDHQWYVGQSGGRVAVFRGIPSEVFGFQLHRVVVLTALPAAEILELDFYRNLPGGIAAESREAADQIVRQMAADLRERRAAEERARREAQRRRQRERRQQRRNDGMGRAA